MRLTHGHNLPHLAFLVIGVKQILEKVREVQKNSNNQDLFVPNSVHLIINRVEESNNFEPFFLVITNPGRIKKHNGLKMF